MADYDSIIFLILLSISISISICISVYFYMNTESATTITYGNYLDINNKTQHINTLPTTFTANTINAVFPGCKPKPGFNPVDKAPIICTKGMFNISGQMNDNSGGFTTINGIAGEFSAKSPGSTFTVDLKQATQQEYTDAQKLING